MSLRSVPPNDGDHDNVSDGGAPASSPAPGLLESQGGQVAELTRQRDEAQQLIELQADPAFLNVWSKAERRAERKQAEKLRDRRRTQSGRSALAEVDRDGLRQRTDDKLAKLTAEDEIWEATARRAQTRLTNAGARLAQLYRTQRRVNRVLLADVAVGLTWTAINVQSSVASGLKMTNPLWWLSFGLEPLISVPLVLLLILRGIAARYGTRFGGRRIFAVEITLLSLTTVLNTAGVLPGLGHWASFAVLLGHLVAPTMVALAVLLQPVITAFFGQLLADAHAAAVLAGQSRLDDDEQTLFARVGRVLRGINAGQLQPSEGSALPSGNAIERFLRQFGPIAKRDAQRVADGVKQIHEIGNAA